MFLYQLGTLDMDVLGNLIALWRLGFQYGAWSRKVKSFSISLFVGLSFHMFSQLSEVIDHVIN